jgi:hypothetical protein
MSITHTYSPDQNLHRFHINWQSGLKNEDRYIQFYDELDEIGVSHYYPNPTADIRVAKDNDEVLSLIIKYSDIIQRQPNCGICLLNHIDLGNFRGVREFNKFIQDTFAATLQQEIDKEVIASLNTVAGK